MAIGLGDVMWFGTREGLVRYDGNNWSLYNGDNSPLPALDVHGVAVRDDGLIGLSAHEFGSVTPFPNGVAVIDGDINDPTNWSVWSYENSPLPHYQIERCEFDAQGNLWVSALSEGVAVLLTGGGEIVGDINGDGEVNVVDLLALIGVWGHCQGCPEDLDNNGVVNVTDLLMLLDNWS